MRIYTAKTMIPNMPSPKSGEPIPAKWGQDVARAINSIARQLIQYPTSRDDGSKLPWKATANGDDTVTVGEGYVISPAGGTSGDVVYSYLKNSTQTLTITADGFIYYRATLGNEALDAADFISMEAYTATVDSGTLVFNAGAALTGGQVDVLYATYAYIPVAKVTLTAGVAAVTEQIAHGDIYISVQTSKDV